MAETRTNFISLLFAAVVALTLCSKAFAQSNCTQELLNLSSCLGFITGTSATAPAPCCTSLATVISSNPICLCEIVNGDPSSSLGSLAINRTIALTLPDVCKLKSPSLTTCKGSGPAAAPTGASNKTGDLSPPGGGSSSSSSSVGRSEGGGFVFGSLLLFLAFFVVGPS